MERFLAEIRRRNVHRVALGYLAASWLLVQILETVLPIYGVEAAPIRWAIGLLIAGFLPTLAVSWIFEWSPGQGLRSQAAVDRDPDAPRDSSRTADRVIIAVLAIAVLVFAVDRFVTTPTVTPAPSVAVLPFEDMTASQDQAYFADGLAEELLNLLADNPGLRVAARSSSFRFRDSSLGLEEIARQLNVDYVLEGSVRRDGDRIRVTAQLIGARDGFHVWSETYDEAFEDIFAIQDNVSARIADALHVSVLGTPNPRRTDPQAYALFLQARYFAFRPSEANLEKAVRLLQRALDIDRDYAPALTNLSAIYATQASHGFIDYDDGFGLARQAALDALEAAPGEAGGYTQLGWIAQWYDGDLASAIAYIEQALALEPSDPVVLGNASILLLHIGNLEDSIRLQEYGIELTPADPIAWHNLALAYQYADRLDDAERSFRRVLELSPDYSDANYQLGETLLLAGDTTAALSSFEASSEESNRMRGRALALYTMGDRDAADAALEELIDRWGEEWPSMVVHVYAWRGEKDEAFNWLEKEYEKFGAAGWGEWKYQRLFDNLRDDPRWNAFLERVGVADEQLAKYEFEGNRIQFFVDVP